MHYSTEKKDGQIINDFEISFRNEPYRNKKKFTNICFNKNCEDNNGTCLNSNNYIKIDEDTHLILLTIIILSTTKILFIY